MKNVGTIGSALLLALLVAIPAYAESQTATAPAGLEKPVDGVIAATAKKEIKPHRTFITIQRYNMENSGETSNPISNVKIELTFPNGQKMELPGNGQYWPIGNGQVQEINRSFEIPFQYLQNDGFKFQVQMVRKGTEFLPCQFDVVQMTEFNRSYVCHTDLGWQTTRKVPADQLDKEGIQVRVFTDLNSKPNEIPMDSLALK